MIKTDGISCLDCGAQFVRSRGYVGEYCEACRPEPPNGGET